MKNTRSTKEVVVIFFFWMMLVTLIVTVGLKVVGLDFAKNTVTSEKPASSEGSLAATVASFQKTLQDNPNNLQALTGLGDAYFDSNHYEQAIEVFIRAEKIAPDSVHIENDLGLLYLNTSDYEKAIAKFTRVLEIDSTHLVSLYYKGAAYFHKGDEQKALQIYQQLLTLNPPPELAQTVKQEIAKIKPDAVFK